MKTKLSLALCALLLSSCATQSIKKEDYVKIKKVAVASLMEDQFHYAYVGVTIFENEYSENPTQVSMNQKIQRKMISQLRKQKKTAKLLPYQQKELLSIYEKKSAVEKFFSSDPIFQKIDFLVDRAKEKGFDHLLVMYPQKHDNAKIFPPGYGFLCRPTFSGFDGVQYAQFSIRFINVETKKAVSYFSQNGSDGHTKPLEGDCKKEWKAYAAPQRKKLLAQLRSDLISDVNTGLQKVLTVKEDSKN